jgi:uncharacterized protein YgiM (DUF1202 family)
MFNLDPHGEVTYKGIKVPVILCHSDSHDLELGNNHGDVYSWFKHHNKDMDDVRNDVAALMGKSNNEIVTPVEPVVPESSAFTPYKAKITADLLNIRAGAGTNYSIVGTLKKGTVVTIIDKANSWSKISNGWISSNYIEKITETSDSKSEPESTLSSTIKTNDIVKIDSNAVYYSGKPMPSWVKNKNWIVKSVNGDKAIIDKSEDGNNAICSPVNVKYLTIVKPTITPSVPTFKSYKVKVTASVLNVRKGAGTNYGINNTIRDKGTYTIVGEADGKGSKKWLKLEDGSGYIASEYTIKI